MVFCSRGVEGGRVILGAVPVRAKGDGGWEQEAGSVGGLGGAGLAGFCGGWLDGAALKLKCQQEYELHITRRTSVSSDVFPAPLVPRRRNVGVVALLLDAR